LQLLRLCGPDGDIRSLDKYWIGAKVGSDTFGEGVRVDFFLGGDAVGCQYR
jgi:hypothetical protein